jgi:transposase-like protein
MMTLTQLNTRFSDEDACKTYLVKLRWPCGVSCPRCKNEKVHKLTRPWTWQCKKCSKQGYRFSPLVGTIFENTNYPLCIWFQVIYLMCQSKKGMSALQIQRTIGAGSYRTAWYMCHRIRAAMKNEEFRKLTGTVEMDETYIGGDNRNRHRNKRLRGRGTVGKIAVIGAIARKGNVVAKMIQSTTIATVDKFVREAVADNVTLVATDEHPAYNVMSPRLPHEVVTHSSGEYVRGNVHTNNLDSFWSLIKRGIMGTFHQVSKDYLPLYLNEFAFRHNYRKHPDMFERVVATC